MDKLKNAWITLNRQCNLRCKWCYAQGTEFQDSRDMSLALSTKIIDLITELDIKNIAFTGGEPTCHNDIAENIKYAASKGLNVCLITNGVALSEQHFLESLVEQGLSSVNLSLKGHSKEAYINNTGVDVYRTVLRAINNISHTSIQQVVSMVLNSHNIETYLCGIKEAVDNGAKEFHFSFEHDFSILDGNKRTHNVNDIYKLINSFTDSYDRLNAITKGHFTLHQSLPLCIWNEDFIDTLCASNQIITSCQLLERSGLVFDTDGALIPCNLMHQVPIAKYGQEFFNKDSFISFWDSRKTVEIYRQLCRHADQKCSLCKKRVYCGGGCLSNWFNFHFDELIGA